MSEGIRKHRMLKVIAMMRQDGHHMSAVCYWQDISLAHLR